jgi:hypothetical protein
LAVLNLGGEAEAGEDDKEGSSGVGREVGREEAAERGKSTASPPDITPRILILEVLPKWMN